MLKYLLQSCYLLDYESEKHNYINNEVFIKLYKKNKKNHLDSIALSWDV